MGVRVRDDVIASFRLVARSEWWVPIDLVAGFAGYVVWVAGSAALGLQVASLADYPVAPDGAPTMPVLGLIAILWLVLPAAVGVARVRSRLLNIRGNVEQDYRLDRPAALLVPPALFLAIVLGAAFAIGAFEPLLFVVLAPATLYLLLRTTAFGYRVYAFSHPMVGYAALFATLVVQAAVLLLYLGLTTENGAVVTATVDALGLPVDPLASTEIAGLAVPTGLAAAVALPIGLGVAYVALQTVAALVVRVRDPTVHPSRVRTGQRYPPWLDVASNAGRSTPANGSAGKATPAKKGTGSDAGGSSGGSTSGTTGSSGASSRSDTSAASAGASADRSSSGTQSEESAAEEDAESVSHTRVFTPPGGTGDDPLAADSVDDDTCPDCGATIPSDADQCPACGADAP